MKRMSLALLAVLGTLVAAGCSPSTQLTHVWHDQSFQPGSIKKVMILAVARNVAVRRGFEDKFAEALKKKGVDAVPSYMAVGDGNLDSTAVIAAIQKYAIEGVFVTRLIDSKMVETYYPPTTTIVAAPAPYYGGWYGYYSTGYAYATSPGYTVQNQVINLETNLYRVADAALIWSALSESWVTQGDDPAREIDPFVGALVEGLVKSRNVISKK